MSEDHKIQSTDENTKAASTLPIDGYSEADPVSGPAYGMSVGWAENLITWLEERHTTIQRSLGANNSLVVGLAGILIVSWLGYLLVIQSLPDIGFDIRTFHRVLRPTPLSTSIKKAYWSLSHAEFDNISLSQQGLGKLHPKQRRHFNQMMQQLQRQRPDLARKIRRSHNMKQAVALLRKHLQKDKPRARNYLSFYARNVFRPRALHIDMAILLTRSLLLGFLMIFSIRLFFDESPIVSEE